MARASEDDDPIDFGDIPEHTGYHIRRAYSYFYRVFTQYGRQFGIRSQQATILTLARHNPGISPARVADANDIERSLVAKLIAELEEQGLLERRPSSTDGRQKGLFITARGADFITAVMDTFARELEPRLTRNLSAAEQKTLRNLLRRVYDDTNSLEATGMHCGGMRPGPARSSRSSRSSARARSARR